MIYNPGVFGIVLEAFAWADKELGTSYKKYLLDDNMEGFGSWWHIGFPLQIKAVLEHEGREAAVVFVKFICTAKGKPYVDRILTVYGDRRGGTTDEEKAIYEYRRK